MPHHAADLLVDEPAHGGSEVSAERRTELVEEPLSPGHAAHASLASEATDGRLGHCNTVQR